MGQTFKPDATLEVDVALAGPAKLVARPTKAVKAGTPSSWTLTTPAEGNVEAKYLESEAALVAPSMKSTDEGWVNFAFLPPVGAQTYHVEVKASKVVKRYAVKTVRELPVEVHCVSEGATALWSKIQATVEAAFAPAGIRFKLTEGSPKKTDRADFVLDAGDDDAPLRDDVQRLFTSGKLPPGRNGTLRVFMVDALVRQEDWTWSPSQQFTATDVLEMGTVQPRKPRNGALVAGSKGFSVKLVPASGPASEVDITSSARVVPPDTVAFDLGGWDLLRFAGRDWKYRFAYEVNVPGYFGWSDGNVIVAATRGPDGAALSPELVARVVIHELGHSLGQAAKERALFRAASATETNERRYTRHGGVGSHCSSGASLVDDATVDGGKTYHWAGGDDMCVMHHDVSKDHVGARFCDSCLLNLRLVDLRVLGPRRMRWT